MKRFSLIVSALCLSVAASAIPAKRGQWRMLTLQDGTQVSAELMGDEFLHFWQTDDGRRFVASANKKGTFQMADMKVLRANAYQKRSTLKRKEQAGKTRAVGEQPTNAITGNKKGLIILVQFTDLKFQAAHTAEFFKRMANERGFNEGNFKGSVRDYFYDQSGRKFDLEFDIAGPYTLPNNMAFYGQNNEKGSDKHPGQMVASAVEMAANDFDFTQYDWDGDHVVDQVFVLYAGQGEANGGSEDTIWPHEWSLEYSDYGAAMNINNMRVDTYACGPELGGGETVSGIGTICHEFTHCLGIPDLYDTEYSGNFGMDEWDLMSSGSYNGNQFCPAGYTSYEKAWCGWLTPIELGSQDQTISNMKALSEGGESYVIYNDGNPNEYFLLENRQQTGWDAALPGKGLLIIHVDYEPNVWVWNKVNTNGTYYDAVYNQYENDHQRCTIVPADNSQGTTSASLAGDPFPFNLRNYFSNVSSPSATLYHKNTDGGNLLNKAVRDIARHADGTMSFRYEAVDTQKEPVFEGVLFYESFDQCNDVGGNDGAWTGGNGTFSPDNDGWEPVDTKATNIYGGANKCGRFGSRVNKGNILMPKIRMGEESTLTFLAAPWDQESTRLSINVSGSSTMTIEPAAFSLTPGKWTECKATIKGAGDVNLRLSPSNNRFFLDEVKIVAGEGTPSGISSINKTESASQRVFLLDGRYAGSEIQSLPPGVYIINGKKVVK